MPLVPLPPEHWQQLEAHQVLQEPAFTSRLPVIGPLVVWFRGFANSISTRWYVRDLSQQQNLFNQAVVIHLHADQERMAGLALQVDGILAALGALTTQQQDLQARLGELAGRVTDLETDHDQWLITQDHEITVVIRNLAEIAAQAAHARQALQDLTLRVAQLDAQITRPRQDGTA